MRPGEAPSKRLETWNSNRAGSNLEVHGVSLGLRGHIFSPWMIQGGSGLGGKKSPGLFLHRMAQSRPIISWPVNSGLIPGGCRGCLLCLPPILP